MEPDDGVKHPVRKLDWTFNINVIKLVVKETQRASHISRSPTNMMYSLVFSVSFRTASTAEYLTNLCFLRKPRSFFIFTLIWCSDLRRCELPASLSSLLLTQPELIIGRATKDYCHIVGVSSKLWYLCQFGKPAVKYRSWVNVWSCIMIMYVVMSGRTEILQTNPVRKVCKFYSFVSLIANIGNL